MSSSSMVDILILIFSLMLVGPIVGWGLTIIWNKKKVRPVHLPDQTTIYTDNPVITVLVDERYRDR